MSTSKPASIVVVGQIGRDLILSIDAIPEPGGSVAVTKRLEQLGGKGANQAVGLRQLGAEVVLIGTVGDDPVGERMLGEAKQSGLDVHHVIKRGVTALLVDVVTSDGTRRLLEDVPPDSLIRPADVRAAAETIAAADTVCLQLQQPAETIIAAATIAREGGALVVLDGSIEGSAREVVLPLADVIRADAAEAAMLTGVQISTEEDALRAARSTLDAGPDILAFGVPHRGDLVAWRGGHRFFPFAGEKPVDTTGAGDAFLAGLVAALHRGMSAEAAGGLAAAAAASTVARLGGRPDLASVAEEIGTG